MTRAVIGTLIIIGGLVAIATGVFGLFGLWWGLILGGTLTIVAALLLIDVDTPQRERSVKR